MSSGPVDDSPDLPLPDTPSPPPVDAELATQHRELTDEEVAEKHRKWMAEHGRVYADEAEKERRLEIFRNNLRYIEARNRENHSFTLGLNQFTDLTNEEFGRTYCGGLAKRDDEGHTPSSDDDFEGAEEEGDEFERRAGPPLGAMPATGAPPPSSETRTG